LPAPEAPVNTGKAAEVPFKKLDAYLALGGACSSSDAMVATTRSRGAAVTGRLLWMEKRVVMSRVLRGGEKDDGMFDIDFWQTVGAEGIFAAAWEMVNEARAFRGEDGDEPRLQRSVVRVIRRGSGVSDRGRQRNR
jgi:hypothetical protein